MKSDDFVGVGWAFPPQLGPGGGIAMVSRERELEEAMRIILSTYPGERPMRPAFGCRLRDFVYRSADTSTAAELAAEVKNSLLRWEPRVSIEDVRVSVDPARPAMMRIDIEYVIVSTNDKRNLVFPFYTIPDDGSDY